MRVEALFTKSATTVFDDVLAPCVVLFGCVPTLPRLHSDSGAEFRHRNHPGVDGDVVEPELLHCRELSGGTIITRGGVVACIGG